eukprot:TRINITY_DN4014_c0_g1_i1.p1 TRINITY_DN4014_c0_g1~~TRINITY_DN4014_c0_g1_i1.p1  ORF type:complete len:1508 (-),score=396.84 TRINITY_DN4014_c0_g1_i1:57-4580(-)
MKSVIIFLSFYFIGCCFAVPDQAVLRQLYTALGGAQWKNSEGWNDVNNKDPSTWSGVNGNYLNLKQNNLVGALPSNFGSIISDFFEIDLSGNPGISGAIPDSISTANSLYVFDCNSCKLSQLPTQFPSNLQYLWMGGNQFQFNILQLFNALPMSIQGMSFSSSKITGDISDPQLIAKLTERRDSIYQLYFDDCLLTGNFQNWPVMKSLSYFNFGGNKLNGLIPMWLFQIENIRQINLQKNAMEGPLPLVFRTPNLGSLYLDENPLIGGEIPDISACQSSIEYFQLGNCGLNGKIPSAFSSYNFANLKYLIIDNNNLQGQIPQINAPLLQGLYAENNQLEGKIPPFNSKNLIYFSVSNNRLSGDVPTDFFRLPSLLQLMLGNNQLTGSIPEDFNSTKLTGLILENNQFSGALPSSFSNLPDLIYLGLENNHFEGEIPELISSINLQNFEVSGNNFTSLPSFSKNTKMQYFSAFNNRIKGKLSSLSFETMTNLIHFNVANNSLLGNIPNFVSSQLAFIDISNNLFNGTLPNMEYCVGLLDVYLGNNSISGELNYIWFVGKNMLNSIILNDNLITGFLTDFTTDYEVKIELPDYIFLRNNKISGQLNFNPLQQMNSQVLLLDVSQNFIEGTLSVFAPSTPVKGSDGSVVTPENFAIQSNSLLKHFNGSHNLFSGPLKMIGKYYPFLYDLYLNDNKLNGNMSGDYNGNVDISNNNFSGDLSVGSGRIADLRASNNNFTSLFSNTITLMENLYFLNVSNNSISTIRTDLMSPRFLMTLDFSSNPLRALPFETGLFAKLVSVTDLDFSNTFINSTIPEEMGQMRSLVNFDISNSQFRGKIPDSLSRLAYLTTFNASRNALEGSIPSLSRYLEVLDLSFNKLSGGIEERVGSLISLYHLDLSSNLLDGNITDSLNTLFDLKVMNISNNKLSGNIPNNLPKRIERLDASNNLLSGNIPDAFGGLERMRYLDLSSNQFSGSIPKSLEKYRNLEVLYLESNSLSLPNAMKPSWKEDIECDARGNEWECPLPSWMSRNCQVSECKISSNASADLELRVKSEDFSSEQDLKNQIRSLLNVSESRINVNYVREGGIYNPKRQNSLQSKLVGLTFSPPILGQENEGSSQRIRDILLLQLSDSNNLGNITILQYSASLSAGTNSELVSKSEDTPFLSLYAIIGIAVGGGVLLILIVVIVVMAVLYKRRRSRKDDNYALELVLKSDVMLKDVTIGNCIGEGHFGSVYVGEWNNTQVALKSLKGEADVMNKWLEEVSLLSKLNHPNVVRLLGIYNANEIFYMVLEFYERGSLDSFLRKDENASRLNVSDLVFMGIEVSKGMIYLESKGIIHRDLGARNLLVTEADGKFCVKISDFGMSRETNFYETKDKKIPFRWAAPELIQFSQSSFKADVWSYGATLWEIFSKGEIPWRSYTNKQVVEIVVDQKKHLEKPAMCPDDVYQVMEQCFEYDPKNRPTFQDIYGRMLKIHGVLPSSSRPVSVVSAEGFYHDQNGKAEDNVGVYQFG